MSKYRSYRDLHKMATRDVSATVLVLVLTCITRLQCQPGATDIQSPKNTVGDFFPMPFCLLFF